MSKKHALIAFILFLCFSCFYITSPSDFTALGLKVFSPTALKSAGSGGTFAKIDYSLQDSLYQKERGASDKVYVIGIDETTLGELGVWTSWPRSVMADLINKLNANPDAKPAVIGVDVMYFGRTDAEPDAALVDACKNAGNIVLANQVSFGKALKTDEEGNTYFDFYHINMLEQPFPELLEHTKQGFINTLADQDGIVRQSILDIDYNGQKLYSFPYVIFQEYSASQGIDASHIIPPTSAYNQWPIPFAANPKAFYGGDSGGLSLSKVLSGEIPAEYFADSIVLIGPYAPGMMDQFYTAINKQEQMNGVEVHANIIQALLDQEFKQQIPLYAGLLILLIAIFGSFILLWRLEIRISALVAILLCGIYIACCFFLYSKVGWILPIFYPIAAILTIFLGQLIYKFILERLEKKKITDTFRKYVAPQVVDNILAKGETELRLGGMKKDIAALFVDIRGFTSLSESLSPEEVVEILNVYLELTTQSIFRYGGTLDKFIGDATMAIFNAPIDLDDYVYKAAQTALAIQEGAGTLEDAIMKKFGKKVSFGIGVNYGPAVVGNIGTSFRMEYTAIGDTVNTAARLESNAKGGQILISQAIYEVLKDRIKVTEIGEIPLKGKSNHVFVYQLDGIL